MEHFFIENSEIILKLLLAVGLGGLIGLERFIVHKEAGMKTHAIVALGSALFVVISEELMFLYGDIGSFDPTRIASQIIVGIGFLGAGSIMLQGSRIKGLTTASGLWLTAGIGMASGFGFTDIAIIATVLVLLVFTLMTILEKPISKLIGDNQEEDK